jgi:hypothetical protein
MSMVKHQFVISTREVADWLDSQPGTWWFIDGDFSLLGKVHFPCPNDELAGVLRQVDKNLIIATDKTVEIADGQRISRHELPLLADTQNRYQSRDFFASWEGDDNVWILSEDTVAAETFSDDAMEEEDGEPQDGSGPAN